MLCNQLGKYHLSPTPHTMTNSITTTSYGSFGSFMAGILPSTPVESTHIYSTVEWVGICGGILLLAALITFCDSPRGPKCIVTILDWMFTCKCRVYDDVEPCEQPKLGNTIQLVVLPDQPASV